MPKNDLTRFLKLGQDKQGYFVLGRIQFGVSEGKYTKVYLTMFKFNGALYLVAAIKKLTKNRPGNLRSVLGRDSIG